ncbi:MAG TPA: hypothetical protein VID67_09650 [Rhizomicrobium sp.]|jgi:hypothetical protein
MTDTVVIAEPAAQSVGYRFSWSLAIGGGVIATAVTFFLLTLGSGFGLLLVSPIHGGVSAPTFFTGGAIYFFVAQAFGFAVGGHFAGRLLGPLVETQMQEDIRAGAHALVAWAVAVLATLTVVAFAGLTVASTGAKTAALYGASTSQANVVGPTAYLVDKLYRPASGSSSADAVAPRAEAARILEAGIANGGALAADDHDRLVGLVSREAGVSHDAAEQRVDAMQSDITAKIKRAAETARKIASYTSLWIAFSLLFGAIVAMGAAVSARIEDDRETPTAVRAGF